MNWPLLRVTVARWQHSRRSSSKVGGWERVQLGKNHAAAQGKFSYGVESPLSWLWRK
jgi:hypothetical protein